MQCVNCGFENIPGMQHCVRCQSSLALTTVEIIPPRASRRRLGNRFIRLRRTIAEQASGAWHVLPWQGRRGLALIPDTLVPGLGHLFRGNWLFGSLFLTGWLFCMVSWLLMFGSEQSWQMLMGALSIHAVALLLLLNRSWSFLTGIAVRAVLGLTLFAALAAVVYRPLQWLGTQFYSPFPVAGLWNSPAFANGDVLLYDGPWRRPLWFKRGDVVVYGFSRQQIRANAGDHGYGYVGREGYGLDRIVGIPGDHVTVQEGQILVNGRPALLTERSLGKLPDSWNLDIQADRYHYIILPSSVGVQVHGNVAVGRILSQVSLVSEEDILGRVVFRTYPWSRWGPVH